MVWVKGELLTEIDAAGVDPSGQLDRVSQPSLFDRRDWFRQVWRQQGGIPLIARVSSEGALAWLFLRRESEDEVTSLSNWYSFAFRPVFSGNPEASRKRAMLTAVAKRLKMARPRIASITMSPVPTADGSAELVEMAFAKAGWSVVSEPCSTSWTATVEGLTFDEYWAARPGQLRSTFKRKGSKADFDVQILTHFDEDAWEDYESVYADSWKPEEGAPEMLRELAQTEGNAGCLRLGICRNEGQAVAAQLWTVENGVALIHKLAHRESAGELSPGTILSAALFRHVVNVDHVRTIDFGTGDDAYKADWMDASTLLYRIRAYNTGTVRGLAAAVKAALSRLVGR
jgi:Acetyltransferase (GNAT) domain